jgi:hypothetical protein
MSYSGWFGLPTRTDGEPNPITIDRIALKELVEKGSDADLLREMIAFIAGRMMELEVEGLTGAGHGERSPTRINPAQRLPRTHLGETAEACGCRQDEFHKKV